MNRKMRMVFRLVLAVVLVVSLVMLFRTRTEYAQGRSSYEEAASVVELPKLAAIPVPAEREDVEEAVSDPNLALLAELNFDELQQENPDVLGWICIPETVVSYPLLQGEDNDFYLKHTWQKTSAKVGSIYMDYRCNAELTDFNTIIYGHRMRDGSMFADLQYYEDQEFWRAHPSIYLVCNEGVYRYDIFSAYEASVRSSVYRAGTWDADSKQAFIDSCIELSAIDTGFVPAADDQILTLSTCTAIGYSHRWVVQSVLGAFYETEAG